MTKASADDLSLIALFHSTAAFWVDLCSSEESETDPTASDPIRQSWSGETHGIRISKLQKDQKDSKMAGYKHITHLLFSNKFPLMAMFNLFKKVILKF